MSMHKIPLTIIEEGGLKAHGLAIGKPSQLADAFRQGVAWALHKVNEGQEPVAVITPGYSICFIGSGPIAPIIEKHNLKIGSFLYSHAKSSENAYGYVREIRPGEWVFSKTCSWGPEVWKPVFLHKQEGRICVDCMDTGWLENREDGKYPCTCVSETEPYQQLKAAFHALKTENESLAPIKEALVKAKLALDSCDVNDTEFPLDTQYYDRELVDEAIEQINKLPK